MSDTAVATIVTGCITVSGMVIGFLTLWVKLRYGVEQKLDHNTAITQEGAEAAATSARAAETSAKRVAETASDAKTTMDSISRRLNGGIDTAISEAVDPVKAHLEDHVNKFDELKSRVEMLDAYIHQRNHDILGGLHVLTTKVGILLERNGSK